MDPSTGGPCQGIRNLVPSLEAIGVQNEVACLDDPDSPPSVSDPFPVHRLGQGRGPWAYCPGLVPWLDQNIQRFDAVLIHGLWLYHSYATTKAVRQSNARTGKSTPVFVMPHGMLDPWFQRDPSRKLKAYRNWVYWKVLEKKVVSSADAMLFTCQRELELAREPFRPYKPRCELNVGYGVASPPQFDVSMSQKFADACPALAGRNYLLFLSRIHAKKGVDLLLRAYADLVLKATERESGDSSKSIPALVIAGPLDDEYAQQMQRLARELDLLPPEASTASSSGPLVCFPGMLQGDTKWGAFYGCDAFVLPSHQENFGIAVVEALACGKPVVISNQVNIYSEIEQAGAAIVDDDSIVGVTRSLERWLSLDAGQRRVMSNAARACYEERYLPISAARRLVDALEKVV
ncbi:glycosyltransferase [Rhodopirellula sp. MGV]|uniref:glycosyltransferase n=1 Tax=Rhodopirellula sp. MGV TaxID=2023130 RepID=UPI000B961454|nr:glycosyltransferase [Rhodopirellula sp. MGV]OYP34113.1 glycosyl transferase family 1 [Rhodopirellula sp. MGV]PNY35610.1 glycosyl transferase family 1 [Rhodopirellula baltica]